MNKFQRKLALFLIDRRLKKMEKQGIRAWKEETFAFRKKQSPVQFIENEYEYRRLRELRFNIEGITSPWRGVFHPYFKLEPKNSKYIEKFEPFEFTLPELKPLDEETQKWADMDVDEFYEALDKDESI